mgnify:CR=1 FL=1
MSFSRRFGQPNAKSEAATSKQLVTTGSAAPGPVRSPRNETNEKRKERISSLLLDSINIAETVSKPRTDAEIDLRTEAENIITTEQMVLTKDEQDRMIAELMDEILGLGPLEPLLARDDISDIMINGPHVTFLDVHGRVIPDLTNFRDTRQLADICQKIVSRVGRRVDQANPLCDARLPDGSRVNVVFPPVAINGPYLTIRKFRRDKLTLEQLVDYGTLSPESAEILKIIARVRCNVIISGGTSSGKTSLLNCMTQYIDADERIITCEDTAELQLNKVHVLPMETRNKSAEGTNEVSMKDLIVNSLRMRPERIIVGEVRSVEAFELLQAMNTGHSGSMGTLHANDPRQALSRLEAMIIPAQANLPAERIRQMISETVDIIIQCQRLRDGSRRVTHITEIIGMEGPVITTQDLVRFHTDGREKDGKLIGYHRFMGIGKPHFYDKARYYNAHEMLESALHFGIRQTGDYDAKRASGETQRRR